MSEISIKAIGDADVVSASNGGMNVNIPIKITRRGRRKVVTLPDGSAMPPRSWNSEPTPIQQALARGHRWLQLLETGKAKNLTEVAEIEGVKTRSIGEGRARKVEIYAEDAGEE